MAQRLASARGTEGARDFTCISHGVIAVAHGRVPPVVGNVLEMENQGCPV